MKPGLSPTVKAVTRRLLTEKESNVARSVIRGVKASRSEIKTNNASALHKKAAFTINNEGIKNYNLSSYISRPNVYYGDAYNKNNTPFKTINIHQVLKDNNITASTSVTNTDAIEKTTSTFSGGGSSCTSAASISTVEINLASSSIASSSITSLDVASLNADSTFIKTDTKDNLIFTSAESAEGINLISTSEHSQYVKLMKEALHEKHTKALNDYKEILSKAAHEVLKDKKPLDDNAWDTFNQLNASDPKKAKKFFLNAIKKWVKNADKELKNASLTLLEKKGWDSLSSKITTEKEQIYENKIIPENRFSFDLKNRGVVSLFENQLGDGTGISCYNNNKETNHAANLWITTLSLETGNPLFSGIRHASLSSPNLSDPAEREAAALNKAKEVLLSAIYLKHKDVITSQLNNGRKITMPLETKLCSVSLLSLMELRFGPLKETEKTQFKDQMNAFKKLAASLKEINIGGEKIPVSIGFLQFNTGVNNIAMNQGMGMIYHHSHWHEADKVNKESLKILLGEAFIKDKKIIEKNVAQAEGKVGGWVKEYLIKLGQGNEVKKQEIILLAKEISHIFNTKQHHSEKEGRYELGKRIAYLSYLIDTVPAFNCKSGKDRTGLMDAEIKALATKLNEKNTLFNKAATDLGLTTDVDKERRQRFYVDPLNYEIQRLNSGASGNKVMNSNSTWLYGELGADLYDEVKGNCNSGV